MRLDLANPARGYLLLTNYRIVFRDYQQQTIDELWQDTSTEIPLGVIGKLEKSPTNNTTLIFTCKDYRCVSRVSFVPAMYK